MISSGHIINNVNSELNNSKKNIPRIGSRDTTAFAPETKYHQGIKKNNIKIHVSPPT